MNNSILGYQEKNTPIHRINALAKLVYFILTSLALMLTYDTRLLIVGTIVSLICLSIAKVEWQSVSFFVKLIAIFSIINLVMVYVFAPEYGVEIYGSRTIVWEGIGRYTLTQEQLFYEFNLLLKYFTTIPLVLILLLTVNPSEFASSFNRIGVPYRIAYAISLTLRYIPDIQRDYLDIRNAQEARGTLESNEETLKQRVQKAVKVALPLILTSFSRIDQVSQAMMLRRFGQEKKRTWYVARKLRLSDYLVILIGILWILVYLWLLSVNDGRFYNPF